LYRTSTDTGVCFATNEHVLTSVSYRANELVLTSVSYREQ
jgi:hypothetical protein